VQAVLEDVKNGLASDLAEAVVALIPLAAQAALSAAEQVLPAVVEEALIAFVPLVAQAALFEAEQVLLAVVDEALVALVVFSVLAFACVLQPSQADTGGVANANTASNATENERIFFTLFLL
jgi:hypothetical protein